MKHSFAYYRLWLFKFLWCKHHTCHGCIFGHVVTSHGHNCDDAWIECPFAWNEENPTLK